MSVKNTLLLGCVADDFTGASDAASFLAQSGMKTLLISNVPEESAALPDQVQAVVIALKTRTARKEDAVRDSMAAFQWLRGKGAQVLYFKYCSTFDCTREGNIGPVADKLMEMEDCPFTIACPALPVNGRVVKNGELLVHGIPLHQTHMKDHPLTPMWDSRIKELLEPQSQYPVYELSIEQMEQHPDELRRQVDEWRASHPHFYLVPDLYEEAHARLIVSIFADLRVWTGGSGLMAALTERLLADHPTDHSGGLVDGTAGPALLIAGSCSSATIAQIADFKARGGIALKIEPDSLLQSDLLERTVWPFVDHHLPSPVLIHSSDTAERVADSKAKFGSDIAEKLENLFAELAERAFHAGVTRVIVAGGETSGAVTQKLGFLSFMLGSSIAPGVPILIPVGHESIRLVLKSGNFGQVDFFSRALAMTGGTDGNT